MWEHRKIDNYSWASEDAENTQQKLERLFEEERGVWNELSLQINAHYREQDEEGKKRY